MPTRGPLPWVLVPGTLCTAVCFEPMLDALALLGPSPDTTAFVPGDLPDPVDTARALLRDAPPEFVLCGFSLGGIVALQAALAEPARVAAMILIGTTGRADPVQNAGPRRALVDAARSEGAAAMIRSRLWDNYVAAGSRTDARLRRAIESMATATGIDRFAHQTEIAIARPSALPELDRLTMPALLISGAEDLATLPERSAELAAGLPCGQHRIIEGCGHFVLMERPEATARAIADWLERPDVSIAVTVSGARSA